MVPGGDLVTELESGSWEGARDTCGTPGTRTRVLKGSESELPPAARVTWPRITTSDATTSSTGAPAVSIPVVPGDTTSVRRVPDRPRVAVLRVRTQIPAPRLTVDPGPVSD